MATAITKKTEPKQSGAPEHMTELELLKQQYRVQMELQELGQQAGHLQEQLRVIEAELKSRVTS
jgi:hypothetical protein